jgi:hypothetical protein
MTRLEELTIKLADDELPDDEWRELERLLATEPKAAATHRRLLEVEAALRGLRETLDLALPTVARLRSGLAASVQRDVMQRLRTGPRPAWARVRAITPSAGDRGWPGRFKFSVRRWPPPRTAMLAFAASFLLVLSLSVWFFGSPTMGQPVLAEVKGQDASIERSTGVVPAVNGMGLQPADVLRLATNVSATITFGAEKTRLELAAGTELNMTSLAHGKRFVLLAGRIEASVARQRLFRPMVILTPQAQARVLGTKFSLLTTANATRLEVTQGKVGFARLSDGKDVQVSAGHYAVAASNYVLAILPLPGKVLREVWLDLPGGTFNELIHHPRYPNAPSEHDFPQNFETTTNWPSAFGTRTRAYLLPPVSGTYQFRISGNGQFCLWMSPDDDPLEKVKIGQLFITRNGPGDSPPEQTTSRQESGPIPLEAGRRYYVEAVHKYGTGEDRLSVTWIRPDGTTEPIPATSLAPFVPKKGTNK